MDVLETDDFTKESEISGLDAGAVITIGNFDGCHVGHQALIHQAVQKKESSSLKTIVLTFTPRPRVFFNPEEKGKNLMTLGQKIRCFKELGADLVVVQKFNKNFQSLSHQDFYNGLQRRLKARSIVVGYNFKFGAQRKGDSQWLEAQCKKDGISLTLMPPQKIKEENSSVISSTTVRQLLTNPNKFNQVENFLGRPYSLEGNIVEGQKIGSQMGFPTANLGDIKQLLPARGVYLGQVWLASPSAQRPSLLSTPSEPHQGVINVGYRPTVSSTQARLSVEAYVFSQDTPRSNWYGKKATFFFSSFLREEKKFHEVSLLKEQIKKDIERAKKILSKKK